MKLFDIQKSSIHRDILILQSGMHCSSIHHCATDAGTIVELPEILLAGIDAYLTSGLHPPDSNKVFVKSLLRLTAGNSDACNENNNSSRPWEHLNVKR